MDNTRLREAAKKLIDFHHEAEQRNEWTFFVDEMYARDCVYTCEYGGTMIVVADGIDEIKATHYGRDMRKGWEGWTFPYMDVYVGEGNRVITHWLNRGPGTRADGSHFQTPGMSFIAHQMHLCDELEAHGLLSPELKKNWVIPMKTKIIEMLSRNMP